MACGLLTLKSRTDQIVDEVDLGTGNVVERDGVDQHRGAGALDDDIVVRFGPVGIEFVLEARATAAGNADTQHGTRGFLTENSSPIRSAARSVTVTLVVIMCSGRSVAPIATATPR